MPRKASRPSRAARQAAALLYAPSPERMQHGRITQSREQVADTAGDIGRPWLAEGSLERLERRGDISGRDRQAGELFHQLFRRAGLDTLKATDWMRQVSAGYGNDRTWPASPEYAARLVWDAINACGGISSPGGSCCWNCLGLEMTVKNWSTRHGLREEVGKGALLTALGMLATHFRL